MAKPDPRFDSEALTRGTLTTIIVFIILFALSIGIFIAAQASNRGPTSSSQLGGLTKSVTDLGPTISLQQAELFTGLPQLQLPTTLPDNLSLYQIRGEQGLVTLIYQSPSLPLAPAYNIGNVFIFIANDNTPFYFPSGPVVIKSAYATCSSLSNGSFSCNTITGSTVESIAGASPTQVTISGFPGWGITYFGSNLTYLTWWGNGAHFWAEGYLPLNALMNIAESMKF